MRGDESLELWLHGYKLDTLQRVLREHGTNTQTVMQARLEELYSQYVSAQERTQISERIEGERLAAERRAEESRRISAFHVKQDGHEQYFTTSDAPEFLMAALRLREYLTKQNGVARSSFAEQYPRREEISPDEYEYIVGVRMDNTGKVSGVYDLDFDKHEFSAVHIMDGWKTYAMGDVSTAAYHATRKVGLSTDQRWEHFLNHLDGKEITSAGHLNARSFSFSDEIVDTENGKLNFYIDTNFDVDAVFGTHVCTDENDDYINLYADYDMEHGQVCDELNIILWQDDGQAELSYTLNAAEKEVLLRKMDEYCQQQTGMTLMDFSARRMAEEHENVPEENQEPTNIEIYWKDLTGEKQREILAAFGENGNYDVFPIATIPAGREQGGMDAPQM